MTSTTVVTARGPERSVILESDRRQDLSEHDS
jgi:hypothetical protein